MANRYANLVGSNKIKDEWQKINDGFDKVEQDVDQLRADLDQEIADREAAVEYVDQRVDNIIVGGGPDKDPELVDIRNLDPSYTPQREINVAGDVTRDMQSQFVAHKADNVKHITSQERTAWNGKISKSINLLQTAIRDLNNVRDEGFYFVGSNAGASEFLNLPVTGFAFSLLVEKHAGTKQTFTTFSITQPRIFVRNEYQDAWSSWLEVYHTNNVPFKTGSGSPEGVVTASVGTIYLRTDGGAGTTLYVKESGTGNTGWVAK